MAQRTYKIVQNVSELSIYGEAGGFVLIKPRNKKRHVSLS